MALQTSSDCHCFDRDSCWSTAQNLIALGSIRPSPSAWFRAGWLSTSHPSERGPKGLQDCRIGAQSADPSQCCFCMMHFLNCPCCPRALVSLQQSVPANMHPPSLFWSSSSSSNWNPIWPRWSSENEKYVYPQLQEPMKIVILIVIHSWHPILNHIKSRFQDVSRYLQRWTTLQNLLQLHNSGASAERGSHGIPMGSPWGPHGVPMGRWHWDSRPATSIWSATTSPFFWDQIGRTSRFARCEGDQPPKW